jgi:hypothetical protein
MQNTPENTSLPIQPKEQEKIVPKEARETHTGVAGVTNISTPFGPSVDSLEIQYAVHPWNVFLSELTFEKHGIRFAFELVICLSFYTALQLGSTFFSSMVDGGAPLGSLLCWFIACISLAIFDHVIFLRPLLTLRNAQKSISLGKFEEGLKGLFQLSPEKSRGTKKSFFHVALKPREYHLYRARCALEMEQYQVAEKELLSARKASVGLSMTGEDFELALFQVEILRRSNHQPQAKELLEILRPKFGSSPLFSFEEFFLNFETAKVSTTGKRSLEAILCQNPTDHWSGVTTHELARPYLSVLRLWSGHAEEALEELTYELRLLLHSVPTSELVRSLLSRLFIERAYYYATHREKDAAEDDIRLATFLALTPECTRAADKVRDELKSRF